ncbi:calcium-translocating P-type ATPase [Kibdelosporangium banguiense]|uniref:Calcium-translocating P-type ATPase n=1 Tax=Kibdelosporangium banguiense TaxID=1365924 RepID=A0ABS4TWN9_9PSEU|nr:cation-transporting P-type ATPase [Kibdelosporangium banguiense]MBP2328783.1 calcium-translocating P-type ATPase [Kibdelosporangium banguiense]
MSQATDRRVPLLTQECTAAEALEAVGSSWHGLSAEDANERLVAHGRNELVRPRQASVVRRFLAQFTDLFAVMLIVAAGITSVAYLLSDPPDIGSLQLAIAILAVVLLNAVIGFMQEYMAERTAEALQAMVPHRARVIRDGERAEVPAAELVPGDLVVVEAGDAVSADCRVVEAHELTVNNMALTGESAPVRRDADPVAASIARLEARDLVWMGTTVTAGTGKAVVVATGRNTEFGRIYQLTAGAATDVSPLRRQVALMARRVAAAAFALGVLLFAVRLLAGGSLVETFVLALGVMVALVPEGLPATMSVALAIGVRRMAKRHALIKKLLAVETLGSTTVICTDKTGTLTKAEMTVQVIWTDGRVRRVSGAGYEPKGEVEDPDSVRELLRVAALCCDARLLPPAGRQGWRVLGDTTEGALLVVAAKAGLDVQAEQQNAARVGELPFDSARKLMTTLHTTDGRTWAHVKGAPQELLARCTHIRDAAGISTLDDQKRRAVLAANDEMAGSALRVLAVAVREVGSARADHDEAEHGLTLLGLVGMLDPPRPEVVAAVQACREAGIRIVMTTGDYALTAEAIARKVGIIPRGAVPRTITGVELDQTDDATLHTALVENPYLLFARVKPEHKMRVVSAFKDLGEIVAVTGDGANDAPALKRADIGVAMGESGTDVAREASVMVLLDDSFASIAAAVELGRSVYQNIRKFLIYLFSHNIGELMPILAATAVGFPLVPLSAVQVLAIDLGSDVLPALALGTEPPEPGVMKTPPRDPRKPLFSIDLVRRMLFLGSIQAVVVTAVFFWHISKAGIPFDAFTSDNPVYREALTMTQAGIVVCQFFNGFAVRSDRLSVFRIGLLSNRPLLAAQAIGLAIMCAISYLPPLQAVFNTAPLSVADWGLLFALGSLVLVADEIRKAVHRRKEVLT